ncbi:hypothetical protein AK830_g11504 [Neonectria ditissima]|uniref:Alpha/beta hydrolase fold-3 domain-containing protein n=1 Tax=Neonectria ditissima TaxID=78410 RepID=A0A0P7B347_9HYPO|nr:hypothetical protein AK830_g11504 [Neonectria ditissima]
MRRCPRVPTSRSCSCIFATSRTPRLRRLFSTRNPERVEVRCGSAGSVTIDLFNVAKHPSSSPFFIHLPPFPSPDGFPAPLPEFLQEKPVASINYRWISPVAAASGDRGSNVARWPMPIHDTLFAYSWLVKNFQREAPRRRDIYVYGSHLGGSLATSLSLTETFPHMRFAVRGVISYNGVYNWTMFLPDHPVNQLPKGMKNPAPRSALLEGTHLHHLQEMLPQFFKSPADLFDPFVSPALFFHNPGLLVPSSYSISEEEAAALEAIIDPDYIIERPKVPRKSHLVYPARASTGKIPECLFLYDSPTVVSVGKWGTRKLATGQGNTMESQALELVELMRRSVDKVELKERRQWDDDVSSDEPDRRVQAMEVGDEREALELNEGSEKVIKKWLVDRIGE